MKIFISLLVVLLISVLVFIALYNPIHYYNYAGSVEDEFGNPVIDAEVEVLFINHESVIARTDDAGRFVMQSEYGSAVKVRAFKQGFLFFCNNDSDIGRGDFSFTGWNIAASEVGVEYQDQNIKYILEKEPNVIDIIDGLYVGITYSPGLGKRDWILMFLSDNTEFFYDNELRFFYPSISNHYDYLVVNDKVLKQKNVVYFKKNLKGKNLFGWFYFTLKPNSSSGPTLTILESGVNILGSEDLRRSRPCYYGE